MITEAYSTCALSKSKTKSMKRTLSRLFIVVCLFFLQVPYSYCQDTKKQQPKKETNKEDADNEDEVLPEENVPTEQPKRMHERVAIGVEAGPNLSLLQIAANSSHVTIGGTIGAYADIKIRGRFYVQPGIYYVMNGGSDVILYRAYPYEATMKINTVEIPVAITYKSGKPGDRTRFTASAVGYFGYNAAGDIHGYSLLIGSDNGDDIKATEVGVGVNVGLEFRDALFIRLKSQRGLTNLVTDPSRNAIYTESYAATIGCVLFGKHHWHRKIKVKGDGSGEFIQKM